MKAATILTPDQRLRVFVSSTLQELAEERNAVKAAVQDLRLTPVMFELGARPHPPRSLYRAYLEQSHIFVGIYWQRYGWVAPGEAISGLEDEYRLSGTRPKLIYVKTPASEREDRLKTLLLQIQTDDQVSYKPFSTPRELRRLLEDDLALLLSERFAASLTEPEPSTPATALSALRSLPLPPTPLIGREQALSDLSRWLLNDQVRLVTLLGPGGVGKSRLALELALQLQASFPDGATFVALGSVTDPALVVTTIAGAVGLQDQGEMGLSEQLKSYFRDKTCLLLLDNFEQVEAAAPTLNELISAVPGLHLLVTSRAALHLSAEHLYEVPPLTLPPRDEAAPAFGALETIQRAEAVRLFEARAKAVKPSFVLSAENAPTVAEICRRLDGLPLAIELAAARANLLTPQALLGRLDRRFETLIGGARDLPTRLQTLRSTIDWSYELLSGSDKTLFARLGVFVGGATLESTEVICSSGAADTLEGLASLVDKSMVRQTESDGDPRFTMLESLRDYALNKLEATGELPVIRAQHATFFLTLVERAESQLAGAHQADWLAQLEREHDNLRSALTWAGEHRPELGLRLAASLWRFWYARGHLSEGREHLAQALAGDTADASTRAKALHGAGVLADARGDYQAARTFLEEALSLRRTLADEEGVATSLNSLGLVLEEQGDYAAAQTLLSESLDLRRNLGDVWGVAASLNNLAKVAYDQGDWVSARPLFEEALELFRPFQDKTRVAVLLTNLGSVAHAQADYQKACELQERSLSLWRELDDEWGIAVSLYNLGHAVREQGDAPRAQSLYTESLTMFWRMKDEKSVAECLEKVAGLAARASPEQAARLWGSADAVREKLGSPLPPHERAAHAKELEAARTACGEAAFDVAWATGREMGLEDAVKLALAVNFSGPGPG